MPNLLNPTNNPEIDKRLRTDFHNLVTGLLTGGIGAPGDVMQGAQDVSTGLLNARMDTIDPMGRARAMSGQFEPLQAPRLPFTSEALQSRLGGDPSSPMSLLGAVGAPEVTDVAKVGGLLNKARGLTDLAPGGLLAQALFHGGPHKFDKFDLGAIGTGEGAQAYGHGLYFAESPGVAKSYQSTVSGMVNPPPRRTFKGKELDAGTPEYHAATLLEGGKPLDEVKREVQGWITDADDWPAARKAERGEQKMLAGWRKTLKTLDEADSPADFAVKPGGHLYEVDIPDETIAKMLDWDAPLSEQPESVRNLIKQADEDELTGWVNWFNREDLSPSGWDNLTEKQQGVIARSLEKDGVQLPRTLEGKFSPSNTLEDTGEDFYKHFSDDPEEASKLLNEAGIPGIRFFDGSSRAKGEGTRNIVVFNPDDITQVKRDGKLVFKK